MKRAIGSEQFDRQVIDRLERLKSVEPRNPQDAASGRVKFLQQAQTLRQAVSIEGKTRHIKWTNPLMIRKEKLQMSTLATILLILALAFSGGGATVAAAQGSLPDDPLYGLKLASEEVRFSLTTQEQSKLDLALAFADRRVEELAAMAQRGEEASAQAASRWEQQVRTAFQLAAGMPDDAMQGALEQIRSRLQAQERLMSRADQTHSGDPVLQRIRERLRVCDEQLEQGLGDHNAFRNMVSSGSDNENGSDGSGCGQDPNCGYGPGKDEDSGRPEESGTPRATDDGHSGPSYGPGPGDGEPTQIGNGNQDGSTGGGNGNQDGSTGGGNDESQTGGGSGGGGGDSHDSGGSSGGGDSHDGGGNQSDGGSGKQDSGAGGNQGGGGH